MPRTRLYNEGVPRTVFEQTIVSVEGVDFRPHRVSATQYRVPQAAYPIPAVRRGARDIAVHLSAGAEDLLAEDLGSTQATRVDEVVAWLKIGHVDEHLIRPEGIGKVVVQPARFA